MREPSAPPALSFPASLAERRSRLSDRLGGSPTPTEATHAVHELLDELLTLDLSRRSTQERQIDERALRIVRESTGFLQAVRATARWSKPIQTADRRPGRPWRTLGLLAVQLVLSLGLAALLFGAIQRGAAGGDAAFAFGLVLAAGLVVLQALTGYHLLGRPRAARPAADNRPEIVLSVDDHAVLSTLTQALLAVDQLEQSVAASSEPATRKQPGLADYPELLRAIQQVYAARRSEDPQRARQRAEGLRASLEQYGLELHDEWTASEPPPPELFTTQRSLDPTSRACRVILPAITDATGVILPGRIAVPGAVPGDGGVAATTRAPHADDVEEWRR
jgi:hypothetical protein